MYTFFFGLPPKSVSEIEKLLKNVWTEINYEWLACRNKLKYEFFFIALNFQAIITFWTWKEVDKLGIVWKLQLSGILEGKNSSWSRG